ncbi:hypothetical protein MWN34_07220 [Ancylobacter sp. 6x-1]|uniref:Phosphate starvation-inducible protein PsiF n=1 Tax=Ancylobacter crimeensis TaxID=2579147 RepID=A0ABT0D9W4_9HYPH|nr:hypothetical protein [Ancylobacter crimeensis]MCK0196704.1 hypothetical protein [Ancylobacter crimeensis]
MRHVLSRSVAVAFTLASLAGAAHAGGPASQVANKMRSPQGEAAFHKCMSDVRKAHGGMRMPPAATHKAQIECDQQAGK